MIATHLLRRLDARWVALAVGALVGRALAGMLPQDSTRARILPQPPGGPIPVRVILSRHDEAVSFDGIDTEVRSPGWEAHVRQSEVPTRPTVDVDTITVGATTYQIHDVFEDAERTEWVLDVS